MGVFAGPEIVESGLVLALDAGNSKGFDDDENLLTYSEQFDDASWSKNNYNVTANATSAPDGTLTADKLIAINASTYHDLYKSPGLGSNTYTLSIFAKEAEQSFIRLRIDDGAIARVAMFNLATGSVSSSSNVTSPTITPYPDGWYRCSITVTSAIVNSVFGSFPTSSGSNYSGDGVSGIFIWGAQLEYGSSASPYYPTTGTAKNRGTTWIDLSGNGNTGTLTNGPTYSSANGGSLVFDGVDDYVNCGTPSISAGKITVNAWVKITTGGIFHHIVDSSSNSWHLAILSSANRPYFWNGSVYHQSAPILTVGQWYMLTGVQGTTLDIYINGVLGQSIATNVSVTTNTVNLGRFQSGSRPFNGNIAQTQIYNRALSAAEIQQNFNATRGRFGI